MGGGSLEMGGRWLKWVVGHLKWAVSGGGGWEQAVVVGNGL